MRHYELMVILDPDLEERTVAPAARPVPHRRPQRRRHRREGRHLGPSPALVRDQQEGRGHLRRRRPAGRAGDRQGARPPAQPQRGRAAHQGPPSRTSASPTSSAASTASTAETEGLTHGEATPSSPSSATSSTTPSCASPRPVRRSRSSASRPRPAYLRQADQRVEGRREPVPPCTVWRQAAENVAESLQRGMRVIVQGRLKQRSYETKEGEKRTVFELEVDEVGPSLRVRHRQGHQDPARRRRRRLRRRRSGRQRPVGLGRAGPGAGRRRRRRRWRLERPRRLRRAALLTHLLRPPGRSSTR